MEGDLGARRFRRLEPRRAEIDQDGAVVFVDQDVGRLDVAVEHADAMGPVEAFGDRVKDVPQAPLVEAAALLQHLRQGHSVLEIHHHVGGAVDFEEAPDADDVGVPGRGREVPQELRFLDELLEPERVHLLRVGIDRDDRVLGIALADRAREIFLDGDKLVEIDALRLVDDPEPADAEHVLDAPLAQDRPVRQRLVAVRFVHRRAPLSML